LVLDFIWLTLSAPRLYRPVIGEIMADTVNFTAAAAFYVIYLTGLFVRPSLPAAENNRWKRLLINPAVKLTVSAMISPITGR